MNWTAFSRKDDEGGLDGALDGLAVVLGGAFSYERGTPAGVPRPSENIPAGVSRPSENIHTPRTNPGPYA